MNVQQLIEFLSHCNPNAEIIIFGSQKLKYVYEGFIAEEDKNPPYIYVADLTETDHNLFNLDKKSLQFRKENYPAINLQ